MVEEAITCTGIENIIDDHKSVDLFSDDFLAELNTVKMPITKFNALLKLLRKAISAYGRTNKVKAVEFDERLRKVVDAYNSRDKLVNIDINTTIKSGTIDSVFKESETMARITKIEAVRDFTEKRKTRVAAYARVSTKSDEQLLSLEQLIEIKKTGRKKERTSTGHLRKHSCQNTLLSRAKSFVIRVSSVPLGR